MSSFRALQRAVARAERKVAATPCACGEYDRDCSTYHACVAAHTELKAAREVLEETFRKLKRDPNAPIPHVGDTTVIDLSVRAERVR